MPDNDQPTLLLVDGHSLAFRAFFALLPQGRFVTSDGQHTEAIYGFISMLLRLLKDEQPTHVGVAFDISRYSFRTREYEEYKGGRDETPPEFIGQVPLLQEALDAMSIPWIVKEDYEADDILATLATQGAAQGFKVLVVSGDRDSFQLVDDNVTVLYPSTLGVSELKRYDAEAVFEKYKVWPHQYPELAALTGEKADNLPGITKVGPVTAAKWIAKYGTVEEIVAHADEITGVVGENLRREQENALRNRRLNALVRDLELPVGPADLKRRPIKEAELREVFSRLQFKTLLDRVLKSGEVDSTGVGETTEGEAVLAVPTVRQLIDEELAKWIEAESAGGIAPLGLRCVLTSPSAPGFGLASLTDSVWVPWAAGRPDYAALEAWLASDAPKHVLDGKHELAQLADAGLELRGIAVDTSLAAWLDNPVGKPMDLGGQIYQFLGESLDDDSDPNQLAIEDTALSPATEAWYLRRIADEVVARLDDGSRRVLDDIEVPLTPVLLRMERAGIDVDRALIEDLIARLRGQATEIANEAYTVIGREVNLGSPKQLQEVLFDQLEMPKTRATKTGYSTDAAALADLQEQHPHPFVDLLLQHRDVTKLSQIAETLLQAIGDDGRIHTSYEQVAAATGRLASKDPNLQNIPVRTEVGRELRRAFRAGGGFETLLTADYSQIEMRIMAHLSGDEGLIEAFRSGEDLHRFVGSRIFGVPPEDVTPLMRTKVKAMSYGLAYGLSAFGLAKQLRIDQKEARALMADYFARFGGVRDYLRGVVEQAKRDGYTTTIFGRRRPFPDLHSSNRQLRDNAERQALNSPIQGSAADIIKIAMIRIDADITERKLASRMLLQVHDELVFEVAAGELAELTEIVTHRMSTAAELSVPLDVQLGTGPNWDAAAH